MYMLSLRQKTLLDIFSIVDRLCTLEEIWKRHGSQGYIAQEKYDKFFENCTVAYPIVIDNPQQYQTSLSFSIVHRICKRPPQNFCYVDNVHELKYRI